MKTLASNRLLPFFLQASPIKDRTNSYTGMPLKLWGGRVVLGKLPVPGRPIISMTVGQGPIALAVGAGGGGLDIFTLIYPFSPLSPSLWETARYRLKYCLKGPLNPKQPTNQPLKLKHLIAKDNTGTAKVALWNDLAKKEYHQNDIIRLSNMKGTTFVQKKLLGSTPNSKAEVSMNQVCMIYLSHKSHKLQIFPAINQRRVCSITVSHNLFVGVLYNCMITKACSRQIVVEDFILES